MGFAVDNTLAIALILILGTWVSQAMSRNLNADAIAEKHEQWMAENGRTYADNVEKDKRFKIFKHNLDFIDKLNSQGNRTYKLGINQFADLTHEEFLRYYTGYKKPTTSNPSPKKSFRHDEVTDVPNSIDWRDQGAVTPIKDQGQCGCCWAFSAVAAIEGVNKIKTGNLVSLSEQQLLDCTKDNKGCSGGWMDNAFKYVIENQGIVREDNYPYEAKQGSCRTDNKEAAAKITNFEDVPANSEVELLKAVLNQPVSVTVDASSEFQYYKGGVFSGSCQTSPTHAVTIVGYGTTDDGNKYWVLKNSWGERWGENGFMRILRDYDSPEGLCGIATHASYPII